MCGVFVMIGEWEILGFCVLMEVFVLVGDVVVFVWEFECY